VIALGGLVTAAVGAENLSGGGLGIALQIGSSLAYGMKYVVVKLLFSPHAKPQGDSGGTNASTALALNDVTPINGGGEIARQELLSSWTDRNGLQQAPLDSEAERGSQSTAASLPTKVQVALIAQPMTGLLSLALLPLFEKSWAAPGFGKILSFAVGITGILLCELRLVELTSPLTVAVMSALHNVVIVLFFVIRDGEPFSQAQQAGFAVSTLGVIGYAWLKHRQNNSVHRS
jgi:drug/metabolite transporter (DMT)-like permease